MILRLSRQSKQLSPDPETTRSPVQQREKARPIGAGLFMIDALSIVSMSALVIGDDVSDVREQLRISVVLHDLQ